MGQQGCFEMEFKEIVFFKNLYTEPGLWYPLLNDGSNL